jgi:hypothetical protein
MELAASDIDGIDLGRPAGDEDIAEASGRGADIERHPSLRIEAEFIERRFELLTAARDVEASLGAQGKLGIRRHESARLQLRLARHLDAASPDKVGGA